MIWYTLDRVFNFTVMEALTVVGKVHDCVLNLLLGPPEHTEGYYPERFEPNDQALHHDGNTRMR